MQELIATYKIVTPMFIGGADQSPADGIRPPSVKGALRFWWRALNWGRFCKDSQNEQEALKNLHKEEARLFGAAMGDKDHSGGQGCFLLSISSGTFKATNKGTVHQEFRKNNASRYLAYGLMEAFASKKRQVEAGQLVRGCIDEMQCFDVKLVFKNKIDPSIKEAVIVLGLLGGLGSRNRHGLGSLSLQYLRHDKNIIWSKPQNVIEYNQQITELLIDKLQAENPAPYTCFDNKSRIELLDNNNSPYEALNSFGKAIMMYRSWGNGGKVLGKPSERNFKDDHDWSKNDPRLPNDFHPQRAVFGLPHNYGKYEHNSVTPELNERRSSPLLLHIHQLDDKSFVSISIFFPTLFLPEGEKIKAGRKKVNCKINYDWITKFLDGYDQNSIQRFPDKKFIIKGSKA